MTVHIESGGPLAAPLDALKAYLRISSAATRTICSTDLIRAATDVAERFIGQLIIARGVEEMLEPEQLAGALAIRPVTSITAVAGAPANGPEFALGVDAYAIDIDGNGDGWLRGARCGRGGAHPCELSRRDSPADADGVRTRSASASSGSPATIMRCAKAQARGRRPRSTALWRPWRRMVLK